MSEWAHIVRLGGFSSEKQMFEELYQTKSLAEVARMLAVSHYTVRKKLVEHGIAVKKKGGARNIKLKEMTPEILRDIEARGIKAVAEDLGLSKAALFRQRRLYYARQEASATKSPSSVAGGSEEPLRRETRTESDTADSREP